MAIPLCFDPFPRRTPGFAPAGSRFLAIAVAVMCILSGTARAGDLAEARTWYKTLGYPDVTNAPYVRVATGRWTSVNDQSRVNRFVEGFLLSEEPEAFTVFLCSVSTFEESFGSDEPYAALTTVRFVRRPDGPVAERIGFEKVDFKEAALAALARVQQQIRADAYRLRFDRPASPRARIFAFAQACRQKDLEEIAFALEEQASQIPNGQTGRKDSRPIREILQDEISEAVLANAEGKFSDPSIPWCELVKPYEKFAERFPASKRIAYAQEAEAVLRKMIAEEAEHHPKPRAEMTKAEQIAEDIFQLRYLHVFHWIQGRYPVHAMYRDGTDKVESVEHLIDAGEAAVPALIEALDNHRFSRSAVQESIHTQDPMTATRVSRVAQVILEHVSGRNFYPVRNDKGELVNGTTRQQAEAWWGEVQRKGEKQLLIEATAAGGDRSLAPARNLAEKYPDAALEAIEAGVRATSEDARRSELIEVAGRLPGKKAASFLKAELVGGKGIYSQLAAARALHEAGDADAVPAMIAAWKKIQPRLPANEDDAFWQVGGLIGFLAECGRVQAIDALRLEAQKAPVDVQLAVVMVFVRGAKNQSMFAHGSTVSSDTERRALPEGEAGLAIDRLLVAALDQTGQRLKMEGNIDGTAYRDPRVCDLAAFVLARRRPQKFQFQWSGTVAERDAQIAIMRARWEAEAGGK
jgi:hypothetical protein